MIAPEDMIARAFCLALSYLLPEHDENRLLLRNVALDGETRRPAQVISNKKAGRKNQGGRKRNMEVVDDFRT